MLEGRKEKHNVRRKSESKKNVVCVDVLLLRSDAHSLLKNYTTKERRKNFVFRAQWNIVKFFFFFGDSEHQQNRKVCKIFVKKKKNSKKTWEKF